MSVTILTGAYGSGKTEVAVNMAIQHAQQAAGLGRHATVPPEHAVCLAGLALPAGPSRTRTVLVDLDITKPMFRSRDLADILAGLGVETISGAAGYELADVPSISPAIYGAIEDRSATVFIDVGGDERGARTLGRLAAELSARGYHMLYVVNANRPFVDTPDAIVSSMQGIECACALTISAVVANTNTGDDSSADDVGVGLEVAQRAASRHGVRLAFVAVSREVMDKQGDEVRAAASRYGVDIRVISRYMLLPWEE